MIEIRIEMRSEMVIEMRIEIRIEMRMVLRMVFGRMIRGGDPYPQESKLCRSEVERCNRLNTFHL